MKKVALIILDGFGLGHHDKGDAIYHAKKPFLQKLFDSQNFARLKTDGEAVGLPSFQTGGSEAGHLAIGAGRPVKQFLTKINEDDFMKNEKLVKLFEKAKFTLSDKHKDLNCEPNGTRESGKIHFVGMISDGGIHSFLPHLLDLLEMAKVYKIREIYIHAITDGRDVGERSAKKFIEQIEEKGIGKIASIGGRFYAMDRDNNWDRIQAAYNVMTGKNSVKLPLLRGEGGGEVKNPAKNSSHFPPDKGARGFVDEFYATSDKSDYYLPPTLLDKNGAIQKNDVVICFNYRIDRMRQLWSAFCDEKFDKFSRDFRLDPQNLGVFGSYYPDAVQIYQEEKGGVKNTLGEVISRCAPQGGGENLAQLRISETEKFNHVTFYFSGGRKEEFAGEDRILIPSPKCASYAEKPEMSAVEQTDALLKKIAEKDYSLIVQNFANSDLVGHSGVLEAAIKSIETLDKCLSREVPALLEKGYAVIITADHGNSDEMLYPNGEPNASHTKNLVPLWILENKKNKSGLTQVRTTPSPDLSFSLKGKKGTLADIAPTILKLLEIEKPAEMTGESLV